jgi:hypothetical protein
MFEYFSIISFIFIANQEPLVQKSITKNFLTLELCQSYEEYVKIATNENPYTNLLYSKCEKKDKGEEV